MAADQLERLGAQLRDELRGAAGPPPPVEVLRRRRTGRRVSRTVVVAAVVTVAAVVAVPQLLPTGGGLTIDPVGPPDDASDPTVHPDDATVTTLDVLDPVPVRVLAVRPNGPSVAVVDLERGEVVTYPRGVHGLPGDAISGATILSDGTVVVWQDDTVRAFTPGRGDPMLVHTPDELINTPSAAPSLRVLPTADGQALWVVQVGSCCADEQSGVAELVSLDSGRVEVTAGLPASTFPVAATSDGLLLTTSRYVDTGDGWVEEPGSRATLLLREDGTSTALSRGEAVAASGDTAAVLTCDDRDDNCELGLLEVDTGERRPVEPPAEGTWSTVTGPPGPGDSPPWSATAPDGRILAGLGVHEGQAPDPAPSHLVAIDPADGSATVLHRLDGPLRPAVWDRRGEHVVFADGRDLVVIDPADGSTTVLRDVVPDEHFVVGMG